MKKLVLVAATAVLTTQGFAQKDSSGMRVNFGFSFGLSNTILSATANDPANIRSAEPVNGSSFRLGTLMEVSKGKHFSLTGKAELAFQENRIKVTRTDNGTYNYELPPTVDLALHVAYKVNIGKAIPYVTAGPGYKVPITSSKLAMMQFTKPTPTIDLGIGMERAYMKFTVLPEIRYSYGLANISSSAGITDVRMNNISSLISFKR